MTDHHDHEPSGYEKKDANVGRIILYGILGVFVTMAVVVFIVDFFVTTREQIVYEAVLQPESAALRALRTREAEALGVYRVVDSAAGVYRIPIEQAMEVMAREYRQRQGTP
jgi:hypothetical protein